jgi:hypothetical protein
LGETFHLNFSLMAVANEPMILETYYSQLTLTEWSPGLIFGKFNVNWILLKKTNSKAFSLQANYTDWATATCRRNLVPTLADRGVSCGQRSGSPMAVNLSFLDRSRYFFFQVAPRLSSRGWVDSIPDPLLLRKFGSPGNRTRDLWVSSQEVWPCTANSTQATRMYVNLFCNVI